MMISLKYILLVINIISFAIFLLIGVPIGIYDFFNRGETDNWIKKWTRKCRIPLNPKQIDIIVYVVATISVVTYFLRKILFEC